MNCLDCNQTLININREKQQLPLKFCENCSKEYAICFCGSLCSDIINGTIAVTKYEYLKCSDCNYIGTRCTSCYKLCEINISSENSRNPFSLFWCCRNCGGGLFWKQSVETSLRTHKSRYRDLYAIDEQVLCLFIFRYVTISTFKLIIRELNKCTVLNFDLMKSLIEENCSQFINIDSINRIFHFINTPGAQKEITVTSFNRMIMDTANSPSINNRILAQPTHDNLSEFETYFNENASEGSIQNLQEQINELKQQLSEGSIQNLQIQINELKQQLNTEIVTRETEVKYLEDQLEGNLKEQIAELETRMINLYQTSESNVTNKITSMENNLETQYKNISSMIEGYSYNVNNSLNRGSGHINVRKKVRGGRLINDVKKETSFPYDLRKRK